MLTVENATKIQVGYPIKPSNTSKLGRNYCCTLEDGRVLNGIIAEGDWHGFMLAHGLTFTKLSPTDGDQIFEGTKPSGETFQVFVRNGSDLVPEPLSPTSASLQYFTHPTFSALGLESSTEWQAIHRTTLSDREYHRCEATRINVCFVVERYSPSPKYPLYDYFVRVKHSPKPDDTPAE